MDGTRMRTEGEGSPDLGHRFMPTTGRFALAFVVLMALAVAATAWAAARGARDSFSTGELLRLEEFPPNPGSPLDDHLHFASELYAGNVSITPADLENRFAPIWTQQYGTAEALDAEFDPLFADVGAVQFLRIRDRRPEPPGAAVLGAAADGTPLEALVELDEDGKIALFGIGPTESQLRRLQAWESALVLLAGAALIVAAAAAWRYRANAEAWMLLAGALSALATILILGDSGIAYTAGRVVPSLMVVFGAALLISREDGRARRWILAIALVGAAAGTLAVFMRDSAPIGHPAIVGRFADSEAAYRVLLGLSAGASALAMAGVAAVNLTRMRHASAKIRPARVVAAALATGWALAASGAAVDYGVGDGTLASGAFAAVAWSALALTPALVIFRLLVTRWDDVDASRARILEASDTARRRVERDLHDGAQQRLVALGLNLQRARRLVKSEKPDELAALLEAATGEVRDTIEEIRAVSRGGLPPLLVERGLASAVDALAELAPVPVSIDMVTERLPAQAERTAYFVVAEGLTNMAKHSMATNADVSITRTNGIARVTVHDDGRGGARIAPGSGLEGLNDRVAATGGTFRISSGPGGTTLEATIPCA